MLHPLLQPGCDGIACLLEGPTPCLVHPLGTVQSHPAPANAQCKLAYKQFPSGLTDSE